MAKKVFSLASVTLTIENGTFGTITIGGGGNLLGTVGYAYDNSLFSVDSTADGGAAVSFNNSLAGTVDISLKQTASKIDEMCEFIMKCRTQPEVAESIITCRDKSGNINFVANGSFPAKIPANSMSERVSDRTFNFVSCEIVPGEAQ